MGLFDFVPGVGGAMNDVGNFYGDMMSGGAISNAKGVEAANAANQGSADKSMAFSERMANTAWQRGTEDMRKAGLNPALAYTQGPAQSPSGSSAQNQAVRKGDVGAGIMNTAKDIYTGSLQGKTATSQVQLNDANIEVADAQSKKLTANATEAELNQDRIRAETKKAKEEAQRSRIAKEVEKAEAPALKKKADADNTMAPIDSTVDRIYRYLPFLKGFSAKSAPSRRSP